MQVCEEGWADCNDEPGCESDLSSERSCGSCDVRCDVGKICEEGACSCPPGLTNCSGQCVDLQSDIYHCGDCDLTCSARNASVSTCESGRCELECKEGYADCDGDPSNGCEVHLSTDRENCGSCGKVCAAGYACVSGACALSCGPDQIVCHESCVDPMSDPQHCGDCDSPCVAGPNEEDAQCTDGVCSTRCKCGWADCNEEPGCETDLRGDPENCGACGLSCPSGICNNGICVGKMLSISHSFHRAACAVDREGRLACWGQSSFGAHGGEFGEILSAPKTVDLPAPALAVGTGFTHSCAVLEDGRIRCWGLNHWGQFGSGWYDDVTLSPVILWSVDPDSPPPPEPQMDTLFVIDEDGIELDDAIHVVAGGMHSCSLHRSGRVYCWGDNSYGQLGSNPPPLPGKKIRFSTHAHVVRDMFGIPISDAVSLAGGVHHNCVVRRSGKILCWGNDYFGQLGRGGRPVVHNFVAEEVEGIDRAMHAAAGQGHSCAILCDGSVSCWGANRHYQRGPGDLSSSPFPIPVPGVEGAIQIDGGYYHTCVVLKDGSARCWGNNSDGQSGDATETFAKEVLTVTESRGGEPIYGIRSIHTLQVASCVGRDDGMLCWGRNTGGQLGTGNEQNHRWPTPVLW